MIESNKNGISSEHESKLTNHARNSFLRAREIAAGRGEQEIRNIHLFLAVFLEKGCMGSVIMQDLGLRKEFFKKYLPSKKPGSGANKRAIGKNKEIPQTSEPLKKTLARAYAAAKKLNYGYVGTEHLVFSLLEAKDEDIKKIVSKTKAKKNGAGANTARLNDKFFKNIQLPPDFLNFTEELDQDHFSPDFFDYPSNPRDDFPEIFETLADKKTRSASYIQKFCVNLNERVKSRRENVIGRQKEIERITGILGRKNKNNPLLVGHPGVGKTALVMGLADMINSGEAPAYLAGKTIMSLDVASLVAGTSFRGEFESRLKEIIKETSANKNIILFIDEIHNIVGAGNASGSLDLANIIKPSLSQGDIQVIGATTHAEYKKYIAKDAALERRFQGMNIKEPSPEETQQILAGVKKQYEDFHHVSINPESITLAIELSQRYLKNRFLPDKAIDIIDEAASRCRARNTSAGLRARLSSLEARMKNLIGKKEELIASEQYEKAVEIRTFEKEEQADIETLKRQLDQLEKQSRTEINSSDIFKVVSHMAGIPENKLSRNQNEKIKKISGILTSQIIGQEEATRKISGALIRSLAGLENTGRPFGSFLFMGPTGVGKTLTAKILSREFFPDPSAFIRIDMSELSERHSLSSLIGSPAGYVGFGEGGRLTEKVRQNPYSVVLFDEIEKAHPDIMNILLQILEEGFLTDAEGLKADFTNTIVILTTNIGTRELTAGDSIGFVRTRQKEISDKFESAREDALKEIRSQIKPEILSRLDDILVFRPLGQKELQKIVKIEINSLKKKLAGQNILLAIPTQVSRLIAKKSLEANQGARLVRKNIREMLEDPIAEMIVFGKVKGGKIKADAKDGRIRIA